MFFLDTEGNYLYDKDKIQAAHAWCQQQTFQALQAGHRVVVTNTFTRCFEMTPYFAMCETFGNL